MKFVPSVVVNVRSYCRKIIACFAYFLIGGLCCFLSSSAWAQTPVLTQHNNNARSGAYTTESALTPANVNQNTFGKLFSYHVDGRIYAQPLYLPNVSISGKGTHNVIFVATEHDSVYAFDADSNGGTNSAPLWQITLLDAAHGAPSGATTVPNGDLSSSDIVPEIGITGTPVIDPSTGTLYVVGKTKEGTVASPTYVQRLHALSLSAGAEKFGGPMTISGSLPGNGNGSSAGVLNFDPKWQMNRSGLFLQNGVIYVAFGSHGDNGPWHGWVFSYNASNLIQLSKFCTTSNGSGSGIWMAGTGLAGDVIDSVNQPYGRMFFATGNGSYSATTPYTNSMSYGDDIVGLDLSGGVLTVRDSFTPWNQQKLSDADEDLASGGVLLLPDQTTGGHTHLLVQAGKEGKIYLVDRDSMGGFNSSTDNVVQEIPNPNPPPNSTLVGGLWSAPAFWNNTLYTWGQSNKLQAYSFSNGLLSSTPTAVGGTTSAYPGATPSVSSNGNSNGIVWAVQTDAYNSAGPAILRAYNATNITNELYDSTQDAARDTAGQATKFVVPTIANGRVYFGTAAELDVYGLLSITPTAATPVISPASQTFSGTLSVTITDSTAGATIYYTTDGSTPTTSSTTYNGPIAVSTTETITAIASATGFLQSLAASQTYILQNQVTAPTFSPPSSSFSSPISVTLSDSTAGARIYYTTNGTVPTTSSALYSAPIAVTGTTTINAIGAASGMINSNVSSATYTLATGTGSNFVNGFSTATSLMTFNGSTGLADTRLQLTNGGTSQAGSAWYNTPLNIQSFTNDFTFQIANPGADGFTFTIQNSGLGALGPSGGGLGYGPDSPGSTPGIGKSVAIKFDIYNNQGEGSDSTGLYTNGASPTIPAVNLTSSGINLLSGDTFAVHMVYDGATLTMTITDGVTNVSYTTGWTVNIPQIVGANTAYLGFTGGTGGLTASQKIETWTFTPSTQSTPQAATPTFGLAAGTYFSTQTVSLADSTSGATIFYTIDGTTPATSVGGSTARYTAPITVTSSETIKAVATAANFSPSAVASASYTIQTQTPDPTFSPVAGTYGSAQNVVISDTASGASIFYTLDGSTPATSAGGSTLLYSTPISISSTKTVKAIASASGLTASNVASAAYTISPGGGGSINFAGGFVGGGMIFNGSSALNGTRLRLTDGGTSEAASAWYGTQVSVTSFTNDFSFQITPGTAPMADGFAFVIQGNGTAALGPSGGGLGYGPDKAGATAGNSILKSVAIKFDLYPNSGETSDSTGLYTNGASPTTPFVDLTGSGVDLRSGHVFNVHMSYDGTTLVMTITDAVTAGSFTQSWPINLATTIGSSAAYFGFTGGTGGYTAIQEIISWTYSSGTSVVAAATPTFSPVAGTYSSAQSVAISDTTSGAAIYYTTDGTTPTTSSTAYSGTIAVASSMTIKAIAAAAGFSNSAVASAAYVIQSAAAMPTFSPVAGTYPSAQSVTLSDSTAGTSIFFTTDGTTPTTASTKFTTAIPVASSMTIKAMATAAGFSNSAVASAAYTIQTAAATPTFSPAAGTYASAQTVTISDTTAGASIYFTVDGSTPTTASTKYTAAISVASSETVKAVAVASGFNNSAVASAAYVIQSAAAMPTFSPVAGTYPSAQSVTLSDSTAGASIFFTTDGTTPTTASTKFTTAIPVASSMTIKAMATAAGFSNSAVANAAYTIQGVTATPTFSPAPGTYATAQSVVISDSTAGAKIYYTTDGSTPTTASTKYSGAIAVASSTTIKAIAAANSLSNSAVASAAYVIQSAAAAPTFSPVAGTYPSAQSVTLSDSIAGASIFFTTDGTTPTTASTKFTTAIPVASSMTIKAMATAAGFSNSAVASAAYIIQATAATPTFSPAAGNYASAQSVTISDTTAGASIFFTTDGTTPTTASTKFTTPISVATTTTLKAIAAAAGTNNSSVATATYTIGAVTGINFTSGFPSATGFQFNGGSALSGTRLRITDSGTYEARSVFWTTPVNIQAFTTDFTFQIAPGTNPMADGFAFVLQNSAVTAVGPYGGGLAYGPDTPGGTPGIAKSIAVKFDIYSNAGEGANSTGLYTNGASPTTPATDLTASGVNLTAGNVMRAHVTYDGATLVLAISNTVTGATFTASWPVNIPTTIGSSTAFAGFTGGTGGYSAVQDVLTWKYTSGAPQAAVTYSTSNLAAVSSGPTFSTFAYSGFPDGTGTLLNSTAVGDSVTLTVNVAQPGIYDVAYTTKEATSRGTTQLAINGSNTGPVIDQYAPADTYSRFDLGNFNFAAAGNYSFKFTVTGKNAASSGDSLAFDDIILTPQ